MLWVKAWHIIFVITWFAGLFYLPRLYVYHAEASDQISIERFKVMEKRLYFGIMYPSAILATALGAWIIYFNPTYYLHAGWLHMKLLLVVLLWAYHIHCGQYLKHFKQNANRHTAKFYRYFNEFPALILIGVVILAVVKPF